MLTAATRSLSPAGSNHNHNVVTLTKKAKIMMKTTRLFMTAALAMTLAACSKDDDGLTPQPAEQQPTEQTTGQGKSIPFTATISIGEGGTTRALTESGTTLTASWAKGEKVALIHNGVSDEMEVASVSGGKATITGEITGEITGSNDVTIIYPATAAKGTTGQVKGNLLKTQEGTLAAVSEKYDVRKGSGTLTVAAGTATLTDDVEMENQFAVWKLTVPTAKNLCILADNETIAGATLIGEQGTEFTVAVPVVTSKTITVVANDDDNNCYYYNKSGISLTAGQYYRSAPAMTTLGTDKTAEGGVYKITGTHSRIGNSVTIPAGKTAVLSGATFSGNHISCSGDATIILMGSNNSIEESGYSPAIRPGGSGTTLTITGTGSLTATGGINNPGIGPSFNGTNGGTCGDIIICGGTIDVTGGQSSSQYTGGAGIGTGTKGTCGNITITTGVTSVTARKGSNNSYNGAIHSIGYGGRSSSAVSCGTVTIGGSPGYINDDTYTYEP